MADKRRRLRAAERREVEGVIAVMMADIEVPIAQMEKTMVDHLMTLRPELRYEALRMAMNEWGNSVFTGVDLGIRLDGQ